ncbi:DNA replication ATP-dependent helicase/nuclease DNA2 isoform X1 [Microplitis mediator]|uniref:DNA replication ATP-dependent helicase/nuclease DNA2 isoform X1 n=1 Tax=Microplitis mediator TaxID=375433 RepID=UPI0025529CF1|nr:DNA replication ATP-dependent helicase/nuclease DNA2 isoform X1 [Microplitis mediator]XP_057319971.1 DNA replication ATP-dependent helicase/nuclease DNA2 isoform X1 [Microplitis mediator]
MNKRQREMEDYDDDRNKVSKQRKIINSDTQDSCFLDLTDDNSNDNDEEKYSKFTALLDDSSSDDDGTNVGNKSDNQHPVTSKNSVANETKDKNEFNKFTALLDDSSSDDNNDVESKSNNQNSVSSSTTMSPAENKTKDEYTKFTALLDESSSDDDNDDKNVGDKSSKKDHHIDVGDSALVNELLSQFSDDDDDDSSFIDSGRGASLALTDQTISSLSVPSNSFNDKKNNLISQDSELIIEDGLGDFFGDWDDDDKNSALDLTQFRRCEVIEVKRQMRCTRVLVEDLESGKRAEVLCSENWLNTQFVIGEPVMVKAVKYFDEWVVNNESGMFVTQADTLVSGTSVVQGIFCERQGILAQKFNGINCLPNIPANDASMSCGTIVHELLQTALKREIYDLPGIRALLNNILKQPHIVQLIYGSELTTKEIKELLDEYVYMINQFMDRYVIGNTPDHRDNDFPGTISCVKDVEENVWLPSLGVKGKIDVTAEVSIDKTRKIMPLEIKTGRASYSAEHKGQLYLYTMMLKSLGHDVNSGLLLYIKENRMQEIASTRHEQRDLILLRNSIAYYLSRQPVVTETENENQEIIKNWLLPELPEPINFVTACKKCTYNTACCLFAKHDPNSELSESHPHVKLTSTLLQHLTDDHMRYIMAWVSMLQMEESYNRSAAGNRSIWSQTPTERETQRMCMSYLTVVKPVVKEDEDAFILTFVRGELKDDSIKLPVKNFNEVFDKDGYVMVNTCMRINIITGYVVDVSKDSVSVSVEKDITKWSTAKFYHLDVVASAMTPYRVLGTLATLLADNDITRKLRRIIIDKQPASFGDESPTRLAYGEPARILNTLNKYQQEALKAAICTNDYALIKGMPGTGKTQTLVALIQILVHLGNSVLITAHTHVAVDNILIKLHEKNVDFLRLGSKNRVHPSLHHKIDEVFLRQCDTVEKLDAAFRKKRIVAVTCLGANHTLLSRRIFDYCLVDECTQALQPVLLRPLYNATKFVLVGDPEQLPAVIRFNEARTMMSKLGMNENMFSRLDSVHNTRILKQQYRMNKPIMDLANKLTYNGELLAGNQKIANATLEFVNKKVVESSEGWVRKCLSCDLKDAVIMLDTEDTYNLRVEIKSSHVLDNEVSRCVNYCEAAVIVKLLNVLREAGIESSEIGVIAPFTAQVSLLKRLIENKIEINTVDQYQGRDKRVIILSCTRSDRRESKKQVTDYEILNDHTRINVALTRAKHKLIIIGDRQSLVRFTPFKKLFDILNDEVMVLKPGCDDFAWDKLSKLVTKP